MMKKTLIVSFLIIGLLVTLSLTDKFLVGNRGDETAKIGKLRATNTFYLPVYSSASLKGGKDSAAAMMYVVASNVKKLFIYNGAAWREVATVNNADSIANIRHRNLPITYVAGFGTPTSGTDNTAMFVKSLALPANTLTRVGDRIHIMCSYKATTGGIIEGDLTLNGVALSSVFVNNADLVRMEVYLEYVNSTTANIIDLISSNTAVQVGSFDFTASQDLVIAQTAVASQHIDIYSLTVDFLPMPY